MIKNPSKKEQLVNFRIEVSELKILQKILIDEDSCVSEFLRMCVKNKIKQAENNQNKNSRKIKIQYNQGGV